MKEAFDKGYTEPDPRDDLSGMDVARKALILARTCGWRMEMKDVKVEVRGRLVTFYERLVTYIPSFPSPRHRPCSRPVLAKCRCPSS